VPDALSLIQHCLVLHRIDPEQGIRRFYSLMIERKLFGNVPGAQLRPDQHQWVED
jgi:predicted DNA-binding WGR domain protein